MEDLKRVRFSAPAIAVRGNDIDTDRIIPARFLRCVTFDGLGEHAFEDDRQQLTAAGKTHAFDDARFTDAEILVVNANFGCGSSREMAVWALAQFGFRCVIAPSFGAIFKTNCIRNGLLPVELPAGSVQALAAAAELAPLVLTVDLPAGTVRGPDGTTHAFTLESQDREMLLTGMDAITRTGQHRAAIDAFEAQDRVRRPWAWGL